MAIITSDLLITKISLFEICLITQMLLSQTFPDHANINTSIIIRLWHRIYASQMSPCTISPDHINDITTDLSWSNKHHNIKPLLITSSYQICPDHSNISGFFWSHECHPERSLLTTQMLSHQTSSDHIIISDLPWSFNHIRFLLITRVPSCKISPDHTNDTRTNLSWSHKCHHIRSLLTVPHHYIRTLLITKNVIASNLSWSHQHIKSVLIVQT